MHREVLLRSIRFELRRTLRDPLTRVAALAFAVILGIGAWQYWLSLPPRPRNSRLFGEAFVVALVIGWHAGIARDRLSRFDIYLASNFVDARSLYFARLGTALAFLAGLSLFAFGLALGASAGNAGYAAHYTTLFLLAFIMALPAIVLIELVLDTRYPVPVLLIVFLAALAIYNRTGDVQRLNRALGFDGNIEPWPAAFRTVLALAIAAAMYPLYRFRLGGHRLAAIIDSS